MPPLEIDEKNYPEYQEYPEYPEYPEYETACTTIRGPRSDKPCVFPFVFNGESKTTCIKGRLRPEPWCATKVNDANEYIRGEWGICGDSCFNFGMYLLILIGSSHMTDFSIVKFFKNMNSSHRKVHPLYSTVFTLANSRF